MPENPKYRVALIGGGRAGPSRARAFDAHPLCDVVAVADTDPENLELTSRRFARSAASTASTSTAATTRAAATA